MTPGSAARPPRRLRRTALAASLIVLAPIALVAAALLPLLFVRLLLSLAAFVGLI